MINIIFHDHYYFFVNSSHVVFNFLNNFKFVDQDHEMLNVKTWHVYIYL